MKTKNNYYLVLVLSIGAAQLAGAIGSYFTFPSLADWYLMLIKPSFTPPGWLFSFVWVILYTLMGIAAWMIWKEHKKHNTTNAIGMYGLQLALNMLWSIIFFGWHNIGAALVAIAVLWLMILVTIILFYRLNRVAAFLLLPYLAWVSFAVVLNWSFWQLNG